MLTAHEIFGFMSPALALEILDTIHASQREIYRAALTTVAEARKVRVVFLERKTRVEQHKDILASICKPNLEVLALNLLQAWLLKSQTTMLTEFLDALGIKHDKGMVDGLPDSVPDEKLNAAVESLLAKNPPEKVGVYLRAFNDLNDTNWPNLTVLLDNDARLQLGA